MLRILVADDHAIVRRGVTEAIEAHPDWTVVGEAADGSSALELALRTTPDIAVLDVAMPILNGVALTRRLSEERPSIKVLLFTFHDDDETIGRALAAGARGYVLKSEGGRHLETAILALQSGSHYFSPQVSEYLRDGASDERSASPLDQFTHRELEVTQLVAEGATNRQIALRLGISVKTVESLRRTAMRKAGAKRGVQLVRFSVKHRLIEP